MELKKLTEVFGSYVYTDKGIYVGEVEDVMIKSNKITSIKVKLAPKTTKRYLELLGRRIRGAIVDINLIKAIGDIIIISHEAIRKER